MSNREERIAAGRELLHNEEDARSQFIGKAKANKAIGAATNLQSLMKEGMPEIEWRVQNIISKGGLTMIAAPPGERKTWIAQDIALHVAMGTPFLGAFNTMKGNVLYIDEENGIHRIHRRFGLLGAGRGVTEYPDNINIIAFENLKLDTTDGYVIFKTLVDHFKAQLVVIDSIVRFMEGNENDATDVRKIFDNIKRIIDETECSFLLLHHTRKDDRQGLGGIRGSGDFAGMCNVVVSMGSKEPHVMRMEIIKNRDMDMTGAEAWLVTVDSPDDNTEVSVKFSHAGEYEKPEDLSIKEQAFREFLHWIDKSVDGDSFNLTSVVNYLTGKGFSKFSAYGARDRAKDTGIYTGKNRGMVKLNRGAFLVEKEKNIRSFPVPENRPENRKSGIQEQYPGKEKSVFLSGTFLSNGKPENGQVLPQKQQSSTGNKGVSEPNKLIATTENVAGGKWIKTTTDILSFINLHEHATPEDIAENAIVGIEAIEHGIKLLANNGDIFENPKGTWRILK